MSLYRIEFDYDLPESSFLEIDMDPALDDAEREEMAMQEIKESYLDIQNINITKVSQI